MPLPYHIIIADDDDNLRALMARVVVRTYPSVRISAVGNGLDALQMYDQHGADLIITNNNMPGMSGLSLVETLRVLRQATLPIIMVSATTTLERQAVALGVNGFVVKPFTLAKLTQVLTQVLPP
jgi:two-component system chemotaxis response regulator CheY